MATAPPNVQYVIEGDPLPDDVVVTANDTRLRACMSTRCISYAVPSSLPSHRRKKPLSGESYQYVAIIRDTAGGIRIPPVRLLNYVFRGERANWANIKEANNRQNGKFIIPPRLYNKWLGEEGRRKRRGPPPQHLGADSPRAQKRARWPESESGCENGTGNGNGSGNESGGGGGSGDGDRGREGGRTGGGGLSSGETSDIDPEMFRRPVADRFRPDIALRINEYNFRTPDPPVEPLVPAPISSPRVQDEPVDAGAEAGVQRASIAETPPHSVRTVAGPPSDMLLSDILLDPQMAVAQVLWETHLMRQKTGQNSEYWPPQMAPQAGERGSGGERYFSESVEIFGGMSISFLHGALWAFAMIDRNLPAGSSLLQMWARRQ